MNNSNQDEEDEPTLRDFADFAARGAEAGGDSIPSAIMFAAFGLALAGVAYGGYQVKKQVDKRKANRVRR